MRSLQSHCTTDILKKEHIWPYDDFNRFWYRNIAQFFSSKWVKKSIYFYETSYRFIATILSFHDWKSKNTRIEMFILEMTKRILRNLHLQAYCRLICAVLSLHFSKPDPVNGKKCTAIRQRVKVSWGKLVWVENALILLELWTMTSYNDHPKNGVEAPSVVSLTWRKSK